MSDKAQETSTAQLDDKQMKVEPQNEAQSKQVEEDRNKEDQQSVTTREVLQQQISTLEQEDQILQLWVQLQEKLEVKYKIKHLAFDAMDANKSGSIEQDEFLDLVKSIPDLEVLKNKELDVFKYVNQSKDGKISKKEWNDAWIQSKDKVEENNHKILMLQHKIQLMEVLESPSKQQSKADDSKLTTKYSSIVEKFKSSSNLTDLSSLFSSVQLASPFKRESVPKKELQSTQISLDWRKDKTQETKVSDPRISNITFTQYRTPRKDELAGDIEQHGRGSFLAKELDAKPAISRIVQRSPKANFTSSTSQNLLKNYQPNIHSKVDQNMNITVEMKDTDRACGKTNRRKDDLNSYMTRLGLCKYDAPRVTVNLDLGISNNRKANVDRMKNIVSGKETANQKGGVGGLLNNPVFSSGSFRQTRRQTEDGKQRIGSRSVSQGKDGLCLIDQSLKNYTLKLIHNHKCIQHQNTSTQGTPQRKTSVQTFLTRN